MSQFPTQNQGMSDTNKNRNIQNSTQYQNFQNNEANNWQMKPNNTMKNSYPQYNNNYNNNNYNDNYNINNCNMNNSNNNNSNYNNNNNYYNQNNYPKMSNGFLQRANTMPLYIPPSVIGIALI